MRNRMKLGKRMERVDMYARLRMPKEAMQKEIFRLVGRLEKSGGNCCEEKLEELQKLVQEEPLDYRKIVDCVEAIVL